MEEMNLLDKKELTSKEKQILDMVELAEVLDFVSILIKYINAKPDKVQQVFIWLKAAAKSHERLLGVTKDALDIIAHKLDNELYEKVKKYEEQWKETTD